MFSLDMSIEAGGVTVDTGPNARPFASTCRATSLDEHAWAEAKVQRWFIHEMANLWQSAHQC